MIAGKKKSVTYKNDLQIDSTKPTKKTVAFDYIEDQLNSPDPQN